MRSPRPYWRSYGRIRVSRARSPSIWPTGRSLRSPPRGSALGSGKPGALLLRFAVFDFHVGVETTALGSHGDLAVAGSVPAGDDVARARYGETGVFQRVLVVSGDPRRAVRGGERKRAAAVLFH